MKPIGVFDSGLGGISFLREAVALLPEESFIYYGDNKNAPYGDKDEATINRLALSCAKKLFDMNVKAIVVACNTATGTAIKSLREKFNIPIISMEPAIKPACEKKGSGKILMLATHTTTHMERYIRLRESMEDPARIIDVACPGLADRIEHSVFDEDAFDDLLSGYLRPYEGMQIDSIVLGCTHYVFIKDIIKRYADMHFSGDATIFDGGLGTARQLDRVLRQNSMRESEKAHGDIRFFTSGDEKTLLPIFDRLLYGNM
ncbi:MAG: glutamate racemase [Clostridia bacterium]|nr:glutamate racemase [Clostridia bacterium]